MERINREEGHLILAAIRVCAHREDTPPTVEQLADLLGMQSETVRLKVEALHEAGAVRAIDSAFERHFEIADHRIVEELKTGAEQTGMEEAWPSSTSGRPRSRRRMGGSSPTANTSAAARNASRAWRTDCFLSTRRSPRIPSETTELPRSRRLPAEPKRTPSLTGGRSS